MHSFSSARTLNVSQRRSLQPLSRLKSVFPLFLCKLHHKACTLLLLHNSLFIQCLSKQRTEVQPSRILSTAYEKKHWMVCVYSPLQMLSVFHMLRIFPSDLFSSFKKINCKINSSPIIQCK